MKNFISILFTLTIVLSIGETYNTPIHAWYDNSSSVVYCGMPNEKAFSIRSKHCRSSVNLYYPINTKQINIDKHIFKIIKVKPTKLIIEKKN